MAVSDNQKLDYLWKKLGYGVAKTDTNDQKLAANESIVSPLLLRADKALYMSKDKGRNCITDYISLQQAED